MTHPSAQRKGYGSKLLRHVAELSGGLPTYLDSHPDATGMYERVGFVKQPDEIRTTKDAWPMVNPGTTR
jgi:GNAT superfamily N-acetyltransferase